MATSIDKAKKIVERIQAQQDIKKLIEDIASKKEQSEQSEILPISEPCSEEGQENRLAFLKQKLGIEVPVLSGLSKGLDLKRMEGNIENFIGLTAVPTGIVGPLKVIGTEANGEYYVPLATSEGALVASYHRGTKACTLAGGVTSICLTEAVQRCPMFRFSSLAELGTFLLWVIEQEQLLKLIVTNCSRYAKLLEMRPTIEGNQLIMTFEYSTGDASGQNMVTLCTDAICRHLVENAPVKPMQWYVESNYSGDKKATMSSFGRVRGKKVSAEVILPKEIVNQVLKTSAEAMHQYSQCAMVSIVQSGAIGAQGHFANGLTALFLATGQDVACVSEASVGITRMEAKPDGSLYACVTLPNLIVGTVGGGTGLFTQKEALELMGCYGEGKSRKYAEIAAALVLCGELSIAAALSAGHFTKAHQKLGRKHKN